MSIARAVKAGLVLAGVACMVVGVRGVVVEHDRTAPLSFLRWFAGSVLLHDFVLVPVVLTIAVALVSRVAPPYRAFVQAGLVVSGIVTIVAFPFVGRFGARSDNASALPLPYARNLAIVLALIWLVIAVLALRARRRAS